MSKQKTIFDKVSEFQETVLGVSYPSKPEMLDEERLNQQVECFEEEIQELKDSTTIADQADALIDLIYFACGTLHKMGVDGNTCFNIVHNANMSKKKGVTKRGHEEDASKPSDWTPPNLDFLNK